MRKSNTVFPYVVVLKQKYRFTIGIISIIAGMIFLLTLAIRIIEYESTRIFNIPILLVASILFYQQYLLVKKNKKYVFRYLYILSAIALTVVPPFQFLSLLFVFLAIFEKPASIPEEIGFSNEKIVFNGILKKEISWNELNNVILKDGIITLDFNNNKILQKETEDDDEDEEYDVSEEEFNEYCRNILSLQNRTPKN